MIDKEALLQLIYQGFERTNLDYKRSIPWEKDTQFELTKDILCFANSGGGYIIIGVDESGKTEEEKFTGVDEDHIETWDVTKVLNTVSGFSSSPIDLNLIPVPDETKNRMFLVLNIPSHGSAPHVCMKNKQDSKGKRILRKGAIYSRTNKKSCEEISDPTEVAELIRRCVLKDKEKLLKEISSIISSGNKANRSAVNQIDSFRIMDQYSEHADSFSTIREQDFTFWEVACIPQEKWVEFTMGKNRSALCEACWDYRGWPFIFYLPNSSSPPRTRKDCLFAVDVKPFATKSRFNYWTFDYANGIFYSKNLTHESATGHQHNFDPEIQIKLLAEAVISVARIYSFLGAKSDGSYTFALRYTGMNDMKIQSILPPDIWYPSTESFSDENLTLARTYELTRLEYDNDIIASELLVELIHRIGFRGRLPSYAFAEKAKTYLSKGNRACDSI